MLINHIGHHAPETDKERDYEPLSVQSFLLSFVFVCIVMTPFAAALVAFAPTAVN